MLSPQAGIEMRLNDADGKRYQNSFTGTPLWLNLIELLLPHLTSSMTKLLIFGGPILLRPICRGVIPPLGSSLGESPSSARPLSSLLVSPGGIIFVNYVFK